MKKLARFAFFASPKFIRRLIVRAVEYMWLQKSLQSLKKSQSQTTGQISNQKSPAKNEATAIQNNGGNKSTDGKISVLFYHIHGLSFGGTEKNLQILAKYLNKDKYNVYYAYGVSESMPTLKNRISYFENTNVTLLPITYSDIAPTHPYVIHDMTPTLAQIIEGKKIDCLVTATPGHTIFPINTIKNIPILLINIFGSFSVQKNITRNINISEEVKKRSMIVYKEKGSEVMYIPSERPIIDLTAAAKIREDFSISPDDFVLGRIGRPDDAIFDPIALNALAYVQKNNPEECAHIHFIIMAPAPAMIKKVKDEQIKNVHFIEPNSDNTAVFAFHNSIDCLAHSRLDGESFGLNIAESMLCAKPILSHVSHIWNAHAEYLDDSFSRIAKKDDFESYGKSILEFYNIFKSDQNTWQNMKKISKEKGERLFLIENNISTFEHFIDVDTSKK